MTVTRVVDGDTVDLSDGQRVRLLGIDAPEAGECGFEEAGAFARAILLYQRVVVTTDSSQALADAYGRSLRYLGTAGSDFSTAAAGAGWAESSTVGVPVEKDAAIRAAQSEAQARHVGIWGGCAAPATVSPAAPAPVTPPSRTRTAPPSAAVQAPQAAVAPRPAPAPPRTTAPKSNCHPSYQPCIPNGPDLDCPDIGFQVKVVGPDSYRLDADGDGTGCDSY